MDKEKLTAVKGEIDTQNFQKFLFWLYLVINILYQITGRNDIGSVNIPHFYYCTNVSRKTDNQP